MQTIGLAELILGNQAQLVSSSYFDAASLPTVGAIANWICTYQGAYNLGLLGVAQVALFPWHQEKNSLISLQLAMSAETGRAKHKLTIQATYD